MLKRIELAGRTCYKSEDLITDDSAEKFVKMIIERGHESVLEHASIAIEIDEMFYPYILALDERDFLNLTKYETEDSFRHIVSGNIHAWRDMFRKEEYYDDPYLWTLLELLQRKIPHLFADLKIRYNDNNIKLPVNGVIGILTGTAHLSAEERMKHEYATARWICNRGVTHELVRSRRQSSYSQESTRFCNYSKNKFGNEITVIDDGQHLENPTESMKVLKQVHDTCEKAYSDLIELGNKPQIARNILPIGLKTEIVITYPLFQWHYFFGLRTTKFVHPQMREITIPMLEAFKKYRPGIFDDIIPDL